MPPNRFESEVESFLEGSHGDRTHIKRADHHTVTPLCGTLLSLVELVAQGCTTWVGIALLNCQCTGALSGALVLYLVHRFAVVKLVMPFRPCVSAGLKPASPLLA